jgi:hypothetical protein
MVSVPFTYWFVVHVDGEASGAVKLPQLPSIQWKGFANQRVEKLPSVNNAGTTVEEMAKNGHGMLAVYDNSITEAFFDGEYRICVNKKEGSLVISMTADVSVTTSTRCVTVKRREVTRRLLVPLMVSCHSK